MKNRRAIYGNYAIRVLICQLGKYTANFGLNYWK